MKIEIREILKSDYNEVISLWNYLGNNTNQANFNDVMNEMNKSTNYRTFVALTEEKKVVGFIMTLQALSIGYNVGFLWICGLAVQKEYQNKGIGTKLLNHIEKYAVERGLSSIILNSGFQRKMAHTFYEHYGYENGSYCFTKKPNLQT